MGTGNWSACKAWSPDPGNVAFARQFVALQLLSRGLSSGVTDVQLVTSELATNAVRHAGGSFVVRIQRLEDTLVLGVSDSSALVPTMARTARLAPSGRGLHIVDQLSSEWGVTLERTGKSVWASFSVQPRAAAFRRGG